MRHHHYFPGQVADQRAWFVNFKKKIAVLGPVLGLSTEEIEQFQSDCQAMIDDIDFASEQLNAGKAAVEKRNLSIKKKLGPIRKAIISMKTKMAYSADLGEQLNIIGEEKVVNYNEVKPVITLFKVPQGVDIKFDLLLTKGANIYCRRGEEVTFTQFMNTTRGHVIDARENLNNAASEQRMYKLILVVNNSEVGIPSDIVTIVN